MKMVVVPRYAELFGNPTPTIEELLIGIPSDAIIGLLSLIQAELQLTSNDYSSQRKILDLFLQNQQPVTRQKFIERLISSARNRENGDFSLFSMNYLLDFLHYVLNHYTDFSIKDTTPEQEFRLLKAYFLFVENRHEQDREVFDANKELPDDFFYKNTWPILSGQYEAAYLVNPFTAMIRGQVLLNFLEFSSPYSLYLKQFLEKRGYASSWHFVFAMTNIIQESWKPLETGKAFTARFFLSNFKEFKQLFEGFLIDPADYKKNFSADHRNYSGIKEKPLFRLNDDTFLVLNWNFFSNKLYEGLVFDFYKHSGIEEVGFSKTFVDFKKYLAEAVTEGYLFKRLLSKSLNSNHSVLLFDEKEKQGFPDAYYRNGNNIILFELKDAYFPANATNTISYPIIKKAIDNKYNQEDKGTGQIIKQLQKLAREPFEEKQGYKYVRNVSIYPVIIYTDHFFSMPGINNYLNEAFMTRVQNAGLRGTFKKINPLVFIDLHFLINHIHLLQKKETCLFSLIELYYKEQQRALKKVKRKNDDLSVYFDCYQTFETAVSKTLGDDIYKREGFVKEIVTALDLTQGLPH